MMNRRNLLRGLVLLPAAPLLIGRKVQAEIEPDTRPWKVEITEKMGPTCLPKDWEWNGAAVVDSPIDSPIGSPLAYNFDVGGVAKEAYSLPDGCPTQVVPDWRTPAWKAMFHYDDKGRGWNNMAREMDSHPVTQHITGRRYGKSHALMAHMYRRATENPDMKIMVVAPTYRMTRLLMADLHKKILNFAEDSEKVRVDAVMDSFVHNTDVCHMKFSNGSFIEGLPFNRNAICGRRYNMICVDEHRAVEEDMLRTAVFPMLNIKINGYEPELHMVSSPRANDSTHTFTQLEDSHENLILRDSAPKPKKVKAAGVAVFADGRICSRTQSYSIDTGGYYLHPDGTYETDEYDTKLCDKKPLVTINPCIEVFNESIKESTEAMNNLKDAALNMQSALPPTPEWHKLAKQA
jgi:hypothetical protein